MFEDTEVLRAYDYPCRQWNTKMGLSRQGRYLRFLSKWLDLYDARYDDRRINDGRLEDHSDDAYDRNDPGELDQFRASHCAFRIG